MTDRLLHRVVVRGSANTVVAPRWTACSQCRLLDAGQYDTVLRVLQVEGRHDGQVATVCGSAVHFNGCLWLVLIVVVVLLNRSSRNQTLV